MTHTNTATEPDEVKGLSVEDLRVYIGQHLTDLATKLDQVQDLVDTRQRGLGFATAEALMAMDEQIRKERAARLWNEKARGGVKITGEVPAPGNIAAWSFLAEAHMLLLDESRRIVRAFHAAGVCTLHQLPPEPSIRQLLGHLRRLSWHLANARRLYRLYIQLEYLVDEATRLLEGADKTRLDGACPHCGRKTLVVYFTATRHIPEGTIRCDRDPDTGAFEDCVCPDPFCACKNDPRHRHEWHRDNGTGPNGWWKLADRLNLNRTK